VKKEVSQQDVLRAQTELANLDAELVRLRQELVSNQARLARLLHASPNTNLQAEEQIPEADVALELERLYAVAVAARPELQAELHMIERERRAKELACKQYYPDATLGVEWMENTTHKAIAPTADGLDDVGLNLSVNLPIYRNRLDAAVREAEARALAAARRYESERDQTLERIKDLFAQVESQRELVRLFSQTILPKAQQTLEVSMADYQTGRVDFQQLQSNFQEVLKIQLMLERQHSQLQQSLASLERTVGGTVDVSTLPIPELGGHGTH
jgi:outer membrane protein TolC